MTTTPRMTKAKATKVAKARLRFGHFSDINTGRRWIYCPDCNGEVSVEPTFVYLSDLARERVLREALIAHLMDPDHDEEN